MKVLIACEYSGRVRDAFIKKGHDAMSCDILPTEVEGPHYQGDVLDVLDDGWDLMVAHPPCTFLSNSGVRWLYSQEGRWQKMLEGADFFRTLCLAPIEKVAVENPVQHKHAVAAHGCGRQTQSIQPWQFGHGEVKRTCLWLKNLPPLEPTDIVEGREARVHRMPPSEDRWKHRSTTLQGIANAMAEQWG